MRKVIIFLMMVLTNTVAFALDTVFIDSVINGEVWNVNQNITTSRNSVIEVDNIFVNKTLYFENHGTINGDIFICDSCNFIIRNDGTFDGIIHSGEKSEITQLIKDKADLKQIYVNGTPFSILVKNIEPLRISDIMKIASGADRIILDNASILFGDEIQSPKRMTLASLSNIALPEIELVGDVIIEVNEFKDLYDGKLILSNVTGDGRVRIKVDDIDPLYVANTVRDKDNVYVNVYRETDYRRFLGKGKGSFINDLRKSDPNNLTVIGLDNAANMTEFDDVVRRSVALNPSNLMRPIKTLNNLEITPMKSGESGIETIYVFSDSSNLYAGKASLKIDLDLIDITISGYTGILDNTDYLNDFSGTFYGGNIRGLFEDSMMWIDATAGFAISSFETDAVFDGSGIVYEVDGISAYSVLDAGTKFDFNKEYYVSPFIGLLGEYENVLYESDLDLSIRIGTIVGISKEVMGIKNDYQLFVILQSNDVKNIGVRLNFWSVFDSAGGSISYAVIDDDFDISHKVSAELRYKF